MYARSEQRKGVNMAVGFLTWRKSSRSHASSGNCVEVAHSIDGVVGVRDSKAGTSGPVVVVGSVAWEEFLDEVRSGRLDLS